jgi:hypothetical protein
MVLSTSTAFDRLKGPARPSYRVLGIVLVFLGYLINLAVAIGLAVAMGLAVAIDLGIVLGSLLPLHLPLCYSAPSFICGCGTLCDDVA